MERKCQNSGDGGNRVEGFGSPLTAVDDNQFLFFVENPLPRTSTQVNQFPMSCEVKYLL